MHDHHRCYQCEIEWLEAHIVELEEALADSAKMLEDFECRHVICCLVENIDLRTERDEARAALAECKALT